MCFRTPAEERLNDFKFPKWPKSQPPSDSHDYHPSEKHSTLSSTASSVNDDIVRTAAGGSDTDSLDSDDDDDEEVEEIGVDCDDEDSELYSETDEEEEVVGVGTGKLITFTHSQVFLGCRNNCTFNSVTSTRSTTAVCCSGWLGNLE